MSEEAEDGSRLDRELAELLNEIRVVLPGVQTIFAFLLIVPFSNRFSETTSPERVLYTIALFSSAVGGVLLMAPTSFHRLRFRRRDKKRLLEVSNRVTVGGLAFLGVAITSAMFLLTEFLYGFIVASALTLPVTAATAGLWWVVPLSRRTPSDRS